MMVIYVKKMVILAIKSWWVNGKILIIGQHRAGFHQTKGLPCNFIIGNSSKNDVVRLLLVDPYEIQY